MIQENETSPYDVIVAGGGAAGLSGALMLARSRRSVLVIDSGQPRNAPASGAHGFLTREGMPPSELLQAGRAEVQRYGVRVVDGLIVSASTGDTSEFVIELADGRRFRARRLLVATGLVDELPEIPGLRERWGRDVLHCPYCHGWEVRDQAIGVIATSPRATHQALLFRQLSDDVVLFQHTGPQPTDDELEQLAARNIPVIAGEIDSLLIASDRIEGVRLRSGSLIERHALVVAPRMIARAAFLAGLGLEPTEHPSGMGEHIETDANGLTAVPGVWVAGNATDLSAQVIVAAAAGARAGAAINADLVTADARRAIASATNHREALFAQS